MHRLAACLAVVALAGCAGAAQPTSSSESAPEASCDELLMRYRATLAAAGGSCSTDAECGVYGGIDPDAVCGGSTDAETARALAAIADERDAARCPRPGYSCPPISPRCVEGACR